MGDPDLPMLDDNPSNTPLDLLLNAISGTGEYAFAAQDAATDAPSGEPDGSTTDAMAAYLEAGGSGVSPPQADPVATERSGSQGSTVLGIRKRSAEATSPPSPRQHKVLRTLQSHFGSRAGLLQPPSPGSPALKSHTFSTVEVWHPKTGQKSYGKERRLLQPPPTLRVTGPLFPLITTVTLRALPNPDPPTGPASFASQTHRIAQGVPGLSPGAMALLYDASATKKDERDQKKRRMRKAASRTGWGGTLPWERNSTLIKPREELVDGLTFPGLWIGEESRKSKEFRLELAISQPGVDTDENDMDVPASSANEQAVAGPTQPLDEAALRQALEGTDIEPLMSLNEASAAADVATNLSKSHAADGGDLAQAVAPTAAATDNTSSKAVPAPWATFVSDPLSIVSKPSQKTAKARSMASCLTTNDAFALFCRINAQTVRTKFMKLDRSGGDKPLLAARAGKWTPFRFDVVERAAPPSPGENGPRNRVKMDHDREAGVITYGSIVQIVDVHTGVRSDAMRLVHVDKNEVYVGANYGHPVSELQRVGFVRVTDGEDDMDNGVRWYLSAPGAMVGAGEGNVTRARPGARAIASNPEGLATVPETLNALDADVEPEDTTGRGGKRKKTKRHALARAAISEEATGSTTAGLTWSRARRHEGEQTTTDSHNVSTTSAAMVETIDDWMCWILGGVWCFSYSFFNGLGEEGALPVASLDPVPRLLVDPVFHPEQNTLDLTLSTFFVPGEPGCEPEPFSVYLGPIGPLRVTTWRSVAPKEKYYDPGALYPAVRYTSGTILDRTPSPDGKRVFSNYPYSVQHVIAMVEMPEPEEIIRIMQECLDAMSEAEEMSVRPLRTDASSPDIVPPPPPDEENSWLGVAGELTIQEALRNAGTAAEEDPAMDVNGAPEGGANGDFKMDEAMIDPALASVDASTSETPTPSLSRNAASSSAVPSIPTVGTADTTDSTTVEMHPPDFQKDSMIPLPLLLVRPDGVGHGIGWSVVAARLGAGNGEMGLSGTSSTDAPWALRVIQTSARGGNLAW